MLATSRTVSKGKLAAFEYLRVVEREAEAATDVEQGHSGLEVELAQCEVELRDLRLVGRVSRSGEFDLHVF